MVGTSEAGHQRIDGEGDEDDGCGDKDKIDQGTDERSKQRKPEKGDEDGHDGVDGEEMEGRVQRRVDGVTERMFA